MDITMLSVGFVGRLSVSVGFVGWLSVSVGWLSVSVGFVGWLSVSVGFVGWLSWSSNYTGCFVFYIITNKCTINTKTVYISQQSLCVMYIATCFDTFLSSSSSCRYTQCPAKVQRLYQQ